MYMTAYNIFDTSLFTNKQYPWCRSNGQLN